MDESKRSQADVWIGMWRRNDFAIQDVKRAAEMLARIAEKDKQEFSKSPRQE
jgi:hypothetical protein